ncbi:MAG: 4-hydroxy-tetrahydrodipicolinate synthase [Polyangiales bacterium]|nr:4-hydroxy-tetrahydrodipicolinate synthase [Myxococcales bacterium]MCB9661481.1 4-hydroxy-tetrahydrodipicolinate synthase [Sandaracinaceae bacterium]
MRKPFDPHGAFTALVTPFTGTGDKAKCDEGAFRANIEFQIANGITGLVPCGTTGESPTLTWDEHNRVIELCVEVTGERVSVLAGTGSNSTDEAIWSSRHARDLGASAGLLVDCYYNGPSSLELREEYYERVLSAVSDFPIVPYIIPGRSGCALLAPDVAILHQASPEMVPAVKQATGDLDRMAEDRELAGDTLAILSGDDDLTLAMMSDQRIRASGVISVMTNLVPGAITEMVQAQAAGDEARAQALQEQLKPLFALVGCAVPATRRLPSGREVATVDKFRNPSAVKTMMAGLGMLTHGLRAPLGSMSQPAVARCREALRAVHQQTPDLLAPIEEAFSVSVAARLADDEVWSGLCR